MKYFFLFLLTFTACTSTQQSEKANPCSDSLYLALKARPYEKLNASEFEYFQKLQAQCYKWAQEHVGASTIFRD
jgi:hypothetical protein